MGNLSFKYQFFHRKAFLYAGLFAKDKTTYAQNKEDVLLDIFTGFKPKGTYIDIGANDPNVISLTKKFYERGWRGINVEPSVKMYELLLRYRPEDKNLNCAVGTGTEVTFYEAGNRAVGSTCSERVVRERNYDTSKISIQKLITVPLRKIFEDNHLHMVDFINMDVEGFEREVISSNDWNRYKAQVLCIEGSGYGDYLEPYGYKKILFDGNNTFYRLRG